MYNYQKTLLYSYKRIDEKIEEYDKLIEYGAYSSKYSFKSTCVLADELLSMVDKKYTLLYLKQKLEKIISCFTQEETKLFEKKYLGLDRDFSYLNDRQYYRKQEKFIKNFSSTLNVFDLTETWFNDVCLSVPFISSIYSVVCKREGRYDARKLKTKNTDAKSEFLISEKTFLKNDSVKKFSVTNKTCQRKSDKSNAKSANTQAFSSYLVNSRY